MSNDFYEFFELVRFFFKIITREEYMNLKNLRKNEHLTQQEMAKICGVTLRSYQNYESGQREMSYASLKKIADKFNISIDYLLGHQPQNVLYLDSLTDEQKEAVELVKQLDDKQVLKVIGYIERIKDTPFEDVINKILKKEE